MWKRGTRDPWTTAYIGKDASRKKFFDCLYCVGQKTVKVGLAKRSGTAHLDCRKCKITWDCTIHHLEEECDVFDRWENACREAAIREVDLGEHAVETKPTAETLTAPTTHTMNKVRKLPGDKRLDLNKFVGKPSKKDAGLVKKQPLQVKRSDKIVATTGKKRKMESDGQHTQENTMIKKTKIEQAPKKEVVHLTQEDLGCLLDASSDEDEDDDLERGLELALAVEAEREQKIADEEAAGRTEAEEREALVEERTKEEDCEVVKQEEIEQQKEQAEEKPPLSSEQSVQTSKSRASSYDSLFGSLSDDPNPAEDNREETEVEVESREYACKIEDLVVTQSINHNFAALHAAFRLEESEAKNIEVTAANLQRSEVKEGRQSESRRSSTSCDSLFGDL